MLFCFNKKSKNETATYFTILLYHMVCRVSSLDSFDLFTDFIYLLTMRNEQSTSSQAIA